MLGAIPEAYSADGHCRETAAIEPVQCRINQQDHVMQNINPLLKLSRTGAASRTPRFELTRHRELRMIPASIALHRRPTPACAVLREILDLEGVADTKALCYNPWARCLGLVVFNLGSLPGLLRRTLYKHKHSLWLNLVSCTACTCKASDVLQGFGTPTTQNPTCLISLLEALPVSAKKLGLNIKRGPP